MTEQRLLSAGNSPNSIRRHVLVCIQQTPACRHGEPPQAVRQSQPRGQDETAWRGGTICQPPFLPPGLLVRTEHTTLTLTLAHLNIHDDKNGPHYYSRLTGGYLLFQQPASYNNPKGEMRILDRLGSGKIKKERNKGNKNLYYINSFRLCWPYSPCPPSNLRYFRILCQPPLKDKPVSGSFFYFSIYKTATTHDKHCHDFLNWSPRKVS